MSKTMYGSVGALTEQSVGATRPIDPAPRCFVKQTLRSLLGTFLQNTLKTEKRNKSMEQSRSNEPSLYTWDPDYRDPVIEVYLKDIDQTLLCENLKLTPAQRFAKFQSFVQSLSRFRDAGLHLRTKNEEDKS